LPICLAEGVKLVRDLSKDEKIFMSDIESDPHRFDFVLYGRAMKCLMDHRS
jgi:hypothetical protein